jgi:hypothetical protein
MKSHQKHSGNFAGAKQHDNKPSQMERLKSSQNIILWICRGKFLWRWIQLLLLPLFLAGGGAMMPDGSMAESLSSLATAAPISTKAAPLTAVDWANFTYVSSCYGSPHSFTTHNGLATSQQIHLEVFPPVYGDLTRDGQPEAIIRYSCSSADFGGVRAFVYTGNKAHPILLGDLPLPVQHRDSSEWIVDQVSINNETLQLKGKTYSLLAARCCPDQQFQASYRWDGVRFVTTHFAITSLGTATNKQ